MTSSIRNQKGIALVATMMLLVLGFAVVAILMRLTTQETKLARLEQGRLAGLDAAKAGADDFIDYAQNCLQTPYLAPGCGNLPLANNPPPGFGATPFGTSRLNGNCLSVKLFNSTATWAANANWAGCGTQTDATSTDTNTNSDITLLSSNYTIYVKIIDTYSTPGPGNPNPNGCYNGCFYYTVLSRAQLTGSTEYSEVYFVYRFDSP